VEPGLGERAQLVAPGVPGFRKAVTKNDQWTFTLFGHMHVDAVCFDAAMP
jgi:hypothetical protein